MGRHTYNLLRRMNAHENEKAKMARYAINYQMLLQSINELNEYKKGRLFYKIPDRVDYTVWKFAHPGKTILNTSPDEIFTWIKANLQ